MTGTKSTDEVLREPFAAGEIGKLPRVTCSKCSDKNNRAGTCDEHPRKERCEECKAWVSPKHIHIDYVGHADVTKRLLQADPSWNWEPLASDEHGLPLLDTDDRGNAVGLWIKLTVGDVTRLGYGSCPGNQHDAVKVLIGDALRNAAMRFGVALDLWAKGDRADPAAENATASAGQARHRSSRRQDDEWESATRAPSRRQQRQEADPAQWETGPADAKPDGHDPAPEGEVDEKAQELANAAHEAQTLATLSPIHAKAHDTGKLSATVVNPATGGKGTLGRYLNWRRDQVQAQVKAIAELEKAAQAAGIADAELDGAFRDLVGTSINEATLAQIKEATAGIAKAGAQA